MLLEEITHLLRVSATTLSPPFRKRTRWISIVKMRFTTDIETSNETTDTKRSDSTFLSEFLFSFCDILRHVFYWRTVIVVQTVTLTLNTSLVGQDPSVSSQPRVSHVDMIIELDYFFDSFAFLKLCHCFFLNRDGSTSAAKMTEDWVTSPTAQRPFLTASIAYSTWSRCPFGENTVIAVSYI